MDRITRYILNLSLAASFLSSSVPCVAAGEKTLRDYGLELLVDRKVKCAICKRFTPVRDSIIAKCCPPLISRCPVISLCREPLISICGNLEHGFHYSCYKREFERRKPLGSDTSKPYDCPGCFKDLRANQGNLDEFFSNCSADAVGKIIGNGLIQLIRQQKGLPEPASQDGLIDWNAMSFFDRSKLYFGDQKGLFALLGAGALTCGLAWYSYAKGKNKQNGEKVLLEQENLPDEDADFDGAIDNEDELVELQ